LSNSTLVQRRFGSIPVELNGGVLALGDRTAAAAPTMESFASLTGTGFSIVSPTAPEAGQPVTLTFATLNRSDRGTFRFVSGIESVGRVIDAVDLTAASSAKIFVTAPPTGALVGAGTTATNRAILPFAIGSTAGSFITFEPDGSIRSLATTEYSGTFAAGENVRLTSTVTNN